MNQRPVEPGSEEAYLAAELHGLAGESHSNLELARRLVEESERRSKEALRLYVPNEIQDSFHRCTAKEALIQGGNQVGKSIAGFVEDARAVTNQDPYNKYPKKGRLLVIGWDDGHIARVIHEYLFMPGRFSIMRDKETGEWKSYRPWVDGEVPSEELHDAPPLIPDRFIKNTVYRKRGANVFSRIDLTTGWEIHAFSSKAEPAQGFQADLVHIDEDLQNLQWYREMVARLTMRKGKLRWTALPHSRNDMMRNLISRCEDEEESEVEETKRSAVHFRITVFDNKYMDDETRKSNIRIWREEGEDVYRQRALGELTTDSIMVYPSFSKSLHDARSDGQTMSEARKIYLNSGGQIPRDWMLSMIVDPGHTMCGVLFIATPPPKLGFERFVFNELAIQHCTAPMFGDRVEHVVRPLHKFQRFIIDAHGGALTSMESGISPRQAYSKELRKHGISCVETGHNFRSGSDDIAGRETELRTWLSLQHGSGEPKVFIDVQMCPRLVRTLPRFLKKEINGIVQEEANRRLECHHIECLEYGAADGLDYISPPKGEQKKVNRVQMILDRMKQDQLRRETKNWIPGVEETISLGPRS